MGKARSRLRTAPPPESDSRPPSTPPGRVLPDPGSRGSSPPSPSRGVTVGVLSDRWWRPSPTLQPSGFMGLAVPVPPRTSQPLRLQPGLNETKHGSTGPVSVQEIAAAVITTINNYIRRRRSLQTLVTQPPPNCTYPSPTPTVFPPPKRQPRRNPLTKGHQLWRTCREHPGVGAPGSSCPAQGASHCDPSPLLPDAGQAERAHHSHGSTHRAGWPLPSRTPRPARAIIFNAHPAT